MKTARFDCIGGASGNMLLGAIADAGVDLAALDGALHALPLPPWSLELSRVQRRGLTALHVEVRYAREHVHRHLPDIAAIISGADGLPDSVKLRSLRVFERLAEAEAAVHGIGRDEVHFHEVGAVDAIVDIVGVVLGLELLGVDEVRVSPLPVGTGPIHCAHGVMPNPAPATAELLGGVPLRFTEVPGELVTPTAAALLVTLGRFESGGGPQAIERIGYGAGTRDSEQVPNVTRVLITADDDAAGDTVVELSTNVDDMNPQVYGHLMERLFEQGALEVFMTAVQMKKNRPGTLFTVLCRPGDERALADIVLRETSTLGVRMQTLQRRVSPRVIATVETSLGKARVKIAPHGLGVQPEYDDCARIARASGLPLLEVMERVRAEARARPDIAKM